MQRWKSVKLLFFATLGLLGLAFVVTKLRHRRPSHRSNEPQPVQSRTAILEPMSLDVILPFIAIFISVVAALLVLADTGGAIRTFVVILFLALAPGYAIVGLVRIKPIESVVALSLALSLVLDIATAGLLLYAHIWSPVASVIILTLVSVLGAVGQLWQITKVAQRSPEVV